MPPDPPASREAGVSLGGNLGDRLARLREARAALDACPGLKVVARSPLYETEPVGVRSEHRHLPFLNAVLILDCRISPDRLSAVAHDIETRLGRVRGEDRYAPRPIDIDILYIANRRLARPELTVPHPAWASRRFVVQPLADVRPALVLPGQARTCAEVLSSLPPHPAAVLFARDW
jgi:2-amino-4-hydroxy-6-hydroxymethyldihydropteridine diphosphokinase